MEMGLLHQGKGSHSRFEMPSYASLARAACMSVFLATIDWKRSKSPAARLAFLAASFFPQLVAAHLPSTSHAAQAASAVFLRAPRPTFSTTMSVRDRRLKVMTLRHVGRIAQAPLVVDHIHDHDELALVRTVVAQTDATVLHEPSEPPC